MTKTPENNESKTERHGGVRSVSRALAILRAFEGAGALSLGEVSPGSPTWTRAPRDACC